MTNLSRLDALCAAREKRKIPEDTITTCEKDLSELLLAEGYTKQCEAYLFDGHAVVGARPLYAYMTAQSDKLAAYRKIRAGNRYKTSRTTHDIRKKFLLNLELLAWLLNRHPGEKILIAVIMNAASRLAQLKDGTFRIHCGKEIEQYFVANLDPMEKNWPAFEELAFKRLQAQRIKAMFQEYLDQQNYIEHGSSADRMGIWLYGRTCSG